MFTPDGGSILSISVEIIDDKVFEGREDFSLTLDSPQPRVVFNPQQTSIAITDNEGERPKSSKEKPKYCGMQGFIKSVRRTG